MSSSNWMSAYARPNSVRRISSAVLRHSSSQPACSKYSSLWLGWRTKAPKVSYRRKIVRNIHTHGNAVDFGLVSRGVVFVQKAFADREGSLNRRQVFLVRCSCCKVLVNVIHSRNNLREIWCRARKEKGRVFKDLKTSMIMSKK